MVKTRNVMHNSLCWLNNHWRRAHAQDKPPSLLHTDVFSQTSKVAVDLWYQPVLDSPQQVVYTNILQTLHAWRCIVSKPLLLLPHGFRKAVADLKRKGAVRLWSHDCLPSDGSSRVTQCITACTAWALYATCDHVQ